VFGARTPARHLHIVPHPSQPNINLPDAQRCTSASEAIPSPREFSPLHLSIPGTNKPSKEFQQDVFKELREEDELVLIARGLGLLRIVTNLLHSYDAAGNNLILLVGADERENVWIGEALAEHAAVSMAPKCRGLSLVNTDLMSVGTREKMYAQGGIFSITSRILIVDFLSGLMNPETVTGIVVLHAEQGKIPDPCSISGIYANHDFYFIVIATSLEAFILRIYRQKNKVGFLKAFSDSPEPFTTGFAPLANMMKNLFLQKPAL
jgi:DNA excision repair protein ERCC-4